MVGKTVALFALGLFVAEALQTQTSRATHAGHAAVHVERLHRYDHAGMESFFQAEAAWDPMVLTSVVGKENAKKLKEMKSNYMEWKEVEDKANEEGVRQFKLIQDHLAKQWAHGLKQVQENIKVSGGGLGIQFAEKIEAMPWFPGKEVIQAAGEFAKNDPAFKRQFGQVSNAQLNVLQQQRGKDAEIGAGTDFGAETEKSNELNEIRDATENHVKYNHRKPDFHVTELSNLYNSQYVGPIGVGTVKKPNNCALPKGSEVMFISGLDVKASKVEQEACHLEEESQIWVVFDTGSTNVWLSSDLCKTAPCTNEGRHQYRHLKSATFSEPANPVHLDITFGTGELKGPQGIDDIHVGPFTVRQQTFGMVEHEIGSVFAEVPFEGILGLAFPAMSANGVKPFFDNVIEQKVMGHNEFAFYFNADDKAGNGIFWGGVDPAFYEGEIKMFPVSQPYYWAVDLKAFKVGETEINIQNVGGYDMKFLESPLNPLAPMMKDAANVRKLFEQNTAKLIVDSGTTYFTAESTVYYRIMSMLKSAPCKSVTDETHPPLKYIVKDVAGKTQEFVIKSNEYMVSDESGSHCEPAFMKIDIPKKYGPGMILGEVFMRNYFTVFDRGDGNPKNAKIGFAKARKGAAVNSKLMELTGGLKHSFKKGHSNGPLVQTSTIQETVEESQFHHKPGRTEGSSEIQISQKKKFRVNPFVKAQ